MIRSEEQVDVSVPQLFESDLITPTAGVETVVVSAVGSFSACDAWFRVPAGWDGDVYVYGRLNDTRILLKQVDVLADAYKTTNGTDVGGIAGSIRGRPVTNFELAVKRRSGGAGRFSLQVWSGSDAPRVVGAGFSATQPAAEEALIAVRSGGVPVLVAGDASGRLLVAGAGTLGSPQGGVLTVQSAARALPRYSVSTSATAKPTIAAAGQQVALALTAGSKRVEVQRILISYLGPTANTGELRIAVSRGTTTPTGMSSAVIPKNFDLADAQALARGRSFVAGGTMGTVEDLYLLTALGSSRERVELAADAWAKPIVLRASTNETVGVRVVTDVAAGSGQTLPINVTIDFIEI